MPIKEGFLDHIVRIHFGAGAKDPILLLQVNGDPASFANSVSLTLPDGSTIFPLNPTDTTPVILTTKPWDFRTGLPPYKVWRSQNVGDGVNNPQRWVAVNLAKFREAWNFGMFWPGFAGVASGGPGMYLDFPDNGDTPGAYLGTDWYLGFYGWWTGRSYRDVYHPGPYEQLGLPFTSIVGMTTFHSPSRVYDSRYGPLNYTGIAPYSNYVAFGPDPHYGLPTISMAGGNVSGGGTFTNNLGKDNSFPHGPLYWGNPTAFSHPPYPWGMNDGGADQPNFGIDSNSLRDPGYPFNSTFGSPDLTTLASRTQSFYVDKSTLIVHTPTPV